MGLNLILEANDIVMVTGGNVVVINSIDEENESARVEVVTPEDESIHLNLYLDDTFLIGDAEVEMRAVNYSLRGGLGVTLTFTADKEVDIHRFHDGQTDKTLQHILYRFPLAEQKLLTKSLSKVWEDD